MSATRLSIAVGPSGWIPSRDVYTSFLRKGKALAHWQSAWYPLWPCVRSTHPVCREGLMSKSKTRLSKSGGTR